MNLLLSPSLLLSIITALTGLSGFTLIRGCTQGSEIAALQRELDSTRSDLQSCRLNLATIQNETLRQANEIGKYNALAAQYRRQLDDRHAAAAQVARTQVPAASCGFDFTSLNNMLSR